MFGSQENKCVLVNRGTMSSAIYLLGIFNGAKGKVGDHLLVCTLIPFCDLNHSIKDQHLAIGG
jgi:hypothetical protein